MKRLIFLTLLMSSTFIYAQDKIRVTYGKHTTTWFSVPEEGISTNLNVRNYSNLSGITIYVKLQSTSEAYKRNIMLEGDDGIFTASINESTTPGRYNIRIIPIKKMLLKQKVIKVYLQQNPANDKMMMPSKQTLLAVIGLK